MKVIDSGEKIKDPICGMEVNENSKFRSVRKGKIYYFCSQSCKETFDARNEYP